MPSDINELEESAQSYRKRLYRGLLRVGYHAIGTIQAFNMMLDAPLPSMRERRSGKERRREQLPISHPDQRKRADPRGTEVSDAHLRDPHTRSRNPFIGVTV